MCSHHLRTTAIFFPGAISPYQILVQNTNPSRSGGAGVMTNVTFQCMQTIIENIVEKKLVQKKSILAINWVPEIELTPIPFVVASTWYNSNKTAYIDLVQQQSSRKLVSWTHEAKQSYCLIFDCFLGHNLHQHGHWFWPFWRPCSEMVSVSCLWICQIATPLYPLYCMTGVFFNVLTLFLPSK